MATRRIWHAQLRLPNPWGARLRACGGGMPYSWGRPVGLAPALEQKTELFGAGSASQVLQCVETVSVEFLRLLVGRAP
jgi:hypothetical protein